MLKLEDYRDKMDKCSHCGYCQAVCPVYRAELMEVYVARARVNLIKAVFVDRAFEVSPRVQEIVYRCLLCTSCSQNCPSGVPVDEIVTAARLEMKKKFDAGGLKKLVMRKVLNQRGIAGLLGKAGSLAQKIGLGAELPSLASVPFEKRMSGVLSPQGERRARVAYFVGCGTNFMYPDTGEATVKALLANGVEVVIPQGLVCCGIPALAEGDKEEVQDAVRTNARILSQLDVEGVVTDCTSCGMMLKVKATKLLEEDDPHLEQVKKVAEKTWEVTQFLHQLGLRYQPRPKLTKLTYHVPCHSGWAPGLKDAPRRLVELLPELELVEMEEPEACCGAAGMFFVDNRELSEKIREPKLKDIEETGADVLITQCPVCRFYLGTRLHGVKVMHPVSLLSEQI
jgi:glycolate oxidase iron-sulfur subunit